MRLAPAFLALGLLAAAPAAGQGNAPAPAPRPAPDAAENPFGQLFTRWEGVNRDSIDAEVGGARQAAEPQAYAVPAYSPLESRTQAEAVALGERVGQVVRSGDCAEGERIAREAGDMALVRAVREHCGRPR
jgi:hypothetical protein